MKPVALAFLLLVPTVALAFDVWDWVQVLETADTQVIEGQATTLWLAFLSPQCTSGCPPVDAPIAAGDVVTWSFGDGSPDVSVTGSTRVAHTFPRGWFDVTVRVNGRTIRHRLFSAPLFVDPPTYVSQAAPLAVSEGAGAAVIELTRSGNLSVSSTVGFSIDYGAQWLTSTTGGTVTFAPGETTKNIVLGLVDDAVYTGPRGVNLTIWSVDGAMLRNAYPSPQYVARVPRSFRIDDDEPQPTISVADVVVTEGTESNSAAVFAVKLSAPAGVDLAFSYILGGGTATPGQDYVQPASQPMPLVISAGVTSIAIAIPILADRIPEPDETFRFQITYANVFSPVIATCTIVNDDGPIGRRRSAR